MWLVCMASKDTGALGIRHGKPGAGVVTGCSGLLLRACSPAMAQVEALYWQWLEAMKQRYARLLVEVIERKKFTFVYDLQVASLSTNCTMCFTAMAQEGDDDMCPCMSADLCAAADGCMVSGDFCAEESKS